LGSRCRRSRSVLVLEPEDVLAAAAGDFSADVLLADAQELAALRTRRLNVFSHGKALGWRNDRKGFRQREADAFSLPARGIRPQYPRPGRIRKTSASPSPNPSFSPDPIPTQLACGDGREEKKAPHPKNLPCPPAASRNPSDPPLTRTTNRVPLQLLRLDLSIKRQGDQGGLHLERSCTTNGCGDCACHCLGVTTEEVVRAVTTLGLHTLDQLRQHTGA